MACSELDSKPSLSRTDRCRQMRLRRSRGSGDARKAGLRDAETPPGDIDASEFQPCTMLAI